MSSAIWRLGWVFVVISVEEVDEVYSWNRDPYLDIYSN